MLFLLTACAPAVASNGGSAALTLTPTPAPAVPVIATRAARTISTALPTHPTDTPESTAAPTRDSAVLPPVETIGISIEGRAISAHSFGVGARTLVVVGGIHGGWEANTVALMETIIAQVNAQPDLIPLSTRLIVIPAANPDGVPRGRTAEGRFNANGVDLNRNWACGWSPDARWRDQAVNPGHIPMSEPETQALAGYLLRVQPAALLSFHSAANGVFAGNCQGDHGSAALARVFGQAAPYPYESAFTAYPVSGTMVEWADGQGIAAADVELINQTDMDFERNWRGIAAVLNWLAEG